MIATAGRTTPEPTIQLVYKNMYMLATAGRTAVPNWLTFFEGTHKFPWG